MTDTIAPQPKPRRWLRWLLYGLGGFVLLVVVAYFYLTSASFLKSFVLPRVSQAAGATVTVEDASISPFSSVTLRQLKVQTTGTEPLVSVREVRVRYRLMDIIGGKINVAEVMVDSPVV